jgi:glyoxylase-like metal-dependent hydrolase (beta-lactamase superfamily II)
MRITNNAEMLEINSERGALYPVLLWDSNEVILIDTALPGQTELLREVIRQVGFALEQITKVILTHQDMDHIGSAKILAGFGAEILAHEKETPYIQGDRTSIRLVEMEKHLSEMDEDGLAFYERMKAGATLFTVPVNRVLKDGELLDFCGGIQVIHTPGHMPGHIALLLNECNTVIAGDAANIFNGVLTGADPNFTLDMPQAEVSFQKMMALNPDSVICYHGGLYL